MGKAKNIRGYKQCLQKFEEIKENYFREQLIRVCDALLFDAYEEREYLGFTGNTQTSYSCGLYIKGKLVYIITLGDSLRPPVRYKVEKDVLVKLDEPYEGKKRVVYGMVDVDDKLGHETAVEFLKNHKASQKHFSIVMTTGTEYSEYIEECRNLNVLSETFNNAKDLLFYNVLPIK